MAIRTVVTRGYGNGTFNGTIPLVVRRGYQSAEPPEVVAVTEQRQDGKIIITALKMGRAVVRI